MDVGGKDTAGKSKAFRVEFEHGEIGEAVLVLIEKLVVENAAWLARFLAAEDPLLIGTEKCLGGAAFDHAAQSLLPPVGARQVRLIEQELGNRDQRRHDQDGNHDAVKA